MNKWIKNGKWINSKLSAIQYHNKLIEFRCHISSTKLAEAQYTTAKSKDQIREKIYQKDECQTPT